MICKYFLPFCFFQLPETEFLVAKASFELLIFLILLCKCCGYRHTSSNLILMKSNLVFFDVLFKKPLGNSRSRIHFFFLYTVQTVSAFSFGAFSCVNYFVSDAALLHVASLSSCPICLIVLVVAPEGSL